MFFLTRLTLEGDTPYLRWIWVVNSCLVAFDTAPMKKSRETKKSVLFSATAFTGSGSDVPGNTSDGAESGNISGSRACEEGLRASID